MKNKLRHSLVLALIIILSIIMSACKEENIEADIDEGEPEYGYSYEEISADYTGSVNRFTVNNDTVYLTTFQRSTDGDASVHQMYSLKPESGEVKKFNKFIVPEAAAVAGLAVTGDRVWAIIYEVLEDNEEEVLAYSLVSVDTADSELKTSPLTNQNGIAIEETALLKSFSFDEEGNMCLLWAMPEPKLSVYDMKNEPELLFELDTKADAKLIKTSDGMIAVGQDTVDGYELKTVDCARKTWNNAVAIGSSVSGCYSGAEYWAYFDDGRNVYGFDAASQSLKKQFGWIDCGLERPSDAVPLKTGEFLFASQSEQGGDRRLMRLLRGELEENNGKTVLTLAVLSDDYRVYTNAVMAFNSSHPDIKIELKDYSVYNTSGPDAGEERLAMDITTGNVPDMIALTNMSGIRYAAKGVFEDLYPYIDNDSDIEREDFSRIC